MELYIKQRIFSWGDKFSVYDQAGNERYHVEGEVFTWGKKLHIYDTAGIEVAFIQQKVWSFFPKYHIFCNDTQIAEVVREFSWFHPYYSVGGLGWSVSGDFFQHEYEITDHGLSVASVSKEWLTWGDTYCLRIADGVDVVAALSVVLVIDACIEQSQNN